MKNNTTGFPAGITKLHACRGTRGEHRCTIADLGTARVNHLDRTRLPNSRRPSVAGDLGPRHQSQQRQDTDP